MCTECVYEFILIPNYERGALRVTQASAYHRLHIVYYRLYSRMEQITHTRTLRVRRTVQL